MLKAEAYGYEYKTVQLKKDYVNSTALDTTLNRLDEEGYFVFHIEKYSDGGSIFIFGRKERPDA